MSFQGDPFLTKRHDTKPFRDVLQYLPVGQDPSVDANWLPLDLTSSSVRFLVSTHDGVPLWGGSASVDSPATAGAVTYSPTTDQMAFATFADSDFPLTLRAEWEVTTSGIIETIPAGNVYRKIVVGLDLG